MADIPLPARSYTAFLFDMDGTILTSIASAERAWSDWARRHGLDVETFLPTIHGVQSVETIRRLALPGVDPVAEAAAITAAEMEDLDDVAPIAGAAEFLGALPADRWAIVTSAPRALALARLGAAGIAAPGVVIGAEDVTRSKPAPDGFLLGAERLGAAPDDCLVFEDSPAGIAAGQAMGADVVAIAGGHVSAVEGLPVIADYRGIAVSVSTDGRLTLRRR